MWKHNEQCLALRTENDCYCADPDGSPDPICDCGAPGWACECPCSRCDGTGIDEDGKLCYMCCCGVLGLEMDDENDSTIMPL